MPLASNPDPLPNAAARAPACDIAIVGGGPVGAAVAIALAQSGLDVRLLEARPAANASNSIGTRLNGRIKGFCIFRDDMGSFHRSNLSWWSQTCGEFNARLQIVGYSANFGNRRESH